MPRVDSGPAAAASQTPAFRLRARPNVEGRTIEPGTYYFRLQVICYTDLGSFVTAQTSVRQFTVSP